MGFHKQRQLEQEAHGFFSELAGYVCDACVDDSALAAFIAEHAERHACDFCGRNGPEPIAADTDEVLKHIGWSLQREWESPLESLPYDSESPSGFFGPSMYDVRDVLEAEDWPFATDAFGEFVVTAFADSQYVPLDPFALGEREALTHSWEEFSDLVKHETRFVFALLNGGSDDVEDAGAPVRRGADMLAEIARLISSWSVIGDLAADVDLYRLRVCRVGSEVMTASELGAPPAHLARQSRMSPAGISMFYGACEVETALAETVNPTENQDKVACIGIFRVRKPARVVDLGRLPAIPSIFDPRPESTRERAELGFLHGFRRDLSKRIERDNRIHIEYVPTQVVSEFLRRVFRGDDGRAAEGLAFDSAQVAGGRNIVLFVDNQQCVEQGARDPIGAGTVLELVATDQRPL